jgi:DNA-directed RNA polymerase specialized sigma24 family protein
MHMNLHSNRTRGDETRKGFCQAFQKDLNSLYQLALLLTGDYRDAESILVAGFEECAGGNPVFKKWARSWARRIIITNAIRLIAPLPWGSDEGYVQNDHELRAWFPGDGPGQAIARLQAFERFVFIMSVLERIPERECAELLGCGTPAVVDARTRALQTIARAELARHGAETNRPVMAAVAVA